MACGDDGSRFGDYLATASDMACVAHGVGLGDELGLFDVIVSLGKPGTSHQIAEAGNFKERYVREWLGLMVVGKIIDYDRATKTYSIPEHRKPYLLESGKEKNMSRFLRGIPVVFGVSRELQQCFPRDGPRGIPYSAYRGFHAWRKARIEARFQWRVLEELLSLVPGLPQRLEQGIEVCDAGCSTAHQALTIAQRYPNSRFLAFDIDEDAIATANQNAAHKGLANVTCRVADGCQMPSDWSNKYDLLFVWDVVHDVPHSRRFLQEILRVLKPGGMFFMMDINAHTELGDNMTIAHAATYYGLSFFHCMPVSLNSEGGDGLGALWGVEKQRQYLEEAGFVDIKQLHPPDQTHSYFVCNKKQ